MGGMSNEDRRAKLVELLRQRKSSPLDGYFAPKTKGGKDKKEAWVNAQKDRSFHCFVRYCHSELEFEPGQKAIAVASITDIPAITDRVIEAVNSSDFDAQMKQISDNLASKIKGGEGNKLQQVA
jgi:hypothetical protein